MLQKWYPAILLSLIHRLTCEGRNYQEEPKGIVFLSKLLLLFQYCHSCFASRPHLSVTQAGTMLSIVSECSSCGSTHTWNSQPFLMGKFPAGNILLSFAIICAGASVGKVLLVFKHMGLLCYNEATYYYHQRHLLVPTIVKFWRSYQAKILQSLNGKEVVLAGDGRHDSMGHSAKYGTYTIFCCTVGLIIHIVLAQVQLLTKRVTYNVGSVIKLWSAQYLDFFDIQYQLFATIKLQMLSLVIFQNCPQYHESHGGSISMYHANLWDYY